jgi:uncharacterized protein YggE
MKKSFILFIPAMMIAASGIYGQAAGNWKVNQSQQASYNTNNAEKLDVSGGNGYDYGYGKSAYNYNYYAPASNDTVIVLESSVMMNVKADSYFAILGVSQVGETIEACHETINTRIQNFTNAIAALGIKKEDVYVDYISQVPIFEYQVEKKLFSKTYNEIPKGFEVKKNIHIKYSDPKIAEKLLTEAAKNEIYDIVKVDFVIRNNETVYDTIRNTCINLLNKKVKEYSKLGIKFIPMYQTIQEDLASTYPIDHYSYFTPFNTPTLKHGDKSEGTDYAYTTTAPSLYYDRLPYNDYDLVINPEITEPEVQFTCKVTMKYVLKKQ